MIYNIGRTVAELREYADSLNYSWVLILVYVLASITAGIFFSTSSRASELPILTLIAVLFGFTINAVVMLANSSDHYLSEDNEHSEQLKRYYQKTLSISIHTLGIGLLAIVLTLVYQLFPSYTLYSWSAPTCEECADVELLATLVYTLVSYYLIVFSTVIVSTAELVKIRLGSE